MSVPRSRWRHHARKVILPAIAEGKAQGLEGEDLRKFVGARYPFGERAMHPYKIWLSEVKACLDPKRKPAARPGDVDPDYWAKLLNGGTS